MRASLERSRILYEVCTHLPLIIMPQLHWCLAPCSELPACDLCGYRAQKRTAVRYNLCFFGLREWWHVCTEKKGKKRPGRSGTFKGDDVHDEAWNSVKCDVGGVGLLHIFVHQEGETLKRCPHHKLEHSDILSDNDALSTQCVVTLAWWWSVANVLP